MNKIISFSVQLFFVLLLSLFIHLFAQIKLGFSYRDFLILESYLINYLLVLFSFSILWMLRNKLASSLGFLFLAGFFVKLMAFFVYFKPEYEIDGAIQRGEFLAFFIPYSLSLVFETARLVRYLNKA